MKRAVRGAALLVAGLGLAAAEPATYRVQPGDTAWSLAQRYHLTLEALLQLNRMSTTDLWAGQVLIVSAETPTQAESDRPTEAGPAVQRGMAVYYVGKPDGGTRLTAAHLNLPFGTWVRVTHERTGRSVTVLVNDRGPFGRPERIIDLSTEAARTLGILDEGVAPVQVEIVQGP